MTRSRMSRVAVGVTRVASTPEHLVLVATCGLIAESCGHLSARRLTKRVGGRVAWTVDNIHVDPYYRRRGVATKLYETAAAYACERRGRLASTNRSTGAYSNEFWQKQVAKGRARSVRRRYGMPPAYVLKDCPVPTLAGRRR